MSELMERVSAARTYLTAKVPFLGFMALRLRPRAATPRDGVPTAAVAPDGTMIINEEFAATLSDPEFRGLIAHEVLHPAMFFFERLGSKAVMPWNWCHDHAINLIILEFVSSHLSQSIQLPPGGLHDPKYIGMSAEEIWATLPKTSKGKGGKGKGGKGGVPSQDGSDGNIPGPGQDCRPDLSDTPDGKAAGQGDASAQERLNREWKVAVTAAAQAHEQHKGQGSLPSGLRILIDEMLNPKHHWAQILSHWLGEHAGKPDLTYMRPSRRSAAVGEILIGRKRTSFPDVTIFWDTSGSQAGTEVKIFPEIVSMCEDLDLRLRVIIIDAAIHADLEDVKEAQVILEALAGGGGSDFRPAFDLMDEERNDSVIIAFTDGYISIPETMPESLKGVVWVLTARGSDPTAGRWGHVLRLDGDDNGEWE